MAAYRDAQAVRDLILREGDRLFGMEPRAVGLFVIAQGDFGVKVTLPRPGRDLPREAAGVPLRIDIEVVPAEALGAAGGSWSSYPPAKQRRTG
ncbi:hypothetical protein [Falsiroseomonas selenitidurans]|uniref:Cyclic nucleotide-binding domain-containing protein n=1 Tax=Falsiroseomonas selenitidurans TaxID=2716335 RepID=A0ABX1E8A3_9PROT|nr:hypothetical protein [Falsiroseomonas selenitidurans]NKC33028.1 hypothetical protein [Falsiroseomonas selenitidurans]